MKKLFAYGSVVGALAIFMGLANPFTDIKSRRVDVAVETSPAAPTDVLAQLPGIGGLKGCRVFNPSDCPLYIGGEDLTAAEGYPICDDSAGTNVCDQDAISVDGRGIYAVVKTPMIDSDGGTLNFDGGVWDTGCSDSVASGNLEVYVICGR